jgi:hypothetical protein
MGVFSDNKFEQLDWMTQITETIESELNTLLAKLPDRLELDVARIRANADSHHFSLRVFDVVNTMLSNFPERRKLAWQEENLLCGCFKFEASPDLELDLEAGTLSGSLALVKIVPTFTDEELQPLMGLRGIQKLSDLTRDKDRPIERVNEMLDILGSCEEAQKNKSYQKKIGRLINRLGEIFTTNEWRIRDTALANRVGVWIAEYINAGNLAALTNLCKLKVMTHSNMPIYSIEEEK